MPHSLSSQPPCRVRDVFAHGHTWVLGSGSLGCTSFPSWCRGNQALLWLQAGACSRGHCASTRAAACTERAGRGAGTSIPTQGTLCHSYWNCSHFPCWKGDGCSSEQVPRSQAVSSHHAQNIKAIWAFTEKLLLVKAPPRWGHSWAGSRSLQARQWEHCWGDGQRAVKPELWLWELVQVSDTCLYNPRMGLVHKICLGLCWINFQMFLRETKPLKYGFYNQSFSFGSWRQLSTVLLLYSVLSDIPKHPTKRLSLQSWDSEYLQQCSAASISESINSSLQEESTLSIPICTSTLKNNFRKQMNHCRAIKIIK